MGQNECLWGKGLRPLLADHASLIKETKIQVICGPHFFLIPFPNKPYFLAGLFSKKFRGIAVVLASALLLWCKYLLLLKILSLNSEYL